MQKTIKSAFDDLFMDVTSDVNFQNFLRTLKKIFPLVIDKSWHIVCLRMNLRSLIIVLEHVLGAEYVTPFQ